MYIHRAAFRQFKNLSDQKIELSSKVTLIYGDNGSGKTNFLEALYYLNTLKPLRPSELIQWGANQSLITASSTQGSEEVIYSILLTKEAQRVLKIQEKIISSTEEYLKQCSVVAFQPQNIQLIRGEPAIRRHYLNRAIFTSNFNYLSRYREYEHVLAQRNAHLKNMSWQVDEEIWKERLLIVGIAVILDRLEFIKRIAPFVGEIYSTLSCSNKTLSIEYDMSKDGIIDGEIDIDQKCRRRLKEVAKEERLRRFSQWGPHRHDLKFLLDNRPLAVAGSQGEQRIAVLALKLAEVELLAQNEIYPLVLLDDLASEIDTARRREVMSYLRRYPYQVVVTACGPSEWPIEQLELLTRYKVVNGCCKQD